MNYGRPVYVRELGGPASTMFIYFAELDCACSNVKRKGWWFGARCAKQGSAVYGDPVYAFHPSVKAMTPPASRWCMLNSRSTIDNPIQIFLAEDAEATKMILQAKLQAVRKGIRQAAGWYGSAPKLLP